MCSPIATPKAPYRIVMVLWDGPTSMETGFLTYYMIKK